MARSLIEEYLHEYGPAPSSDIKKYLLAKGLSEDAARKVISRRGQGINVYTTISLPKREGFIYLDRQYNSEQFWKRLIQAHISHNTAYGIAVASLIARGGACPENYFCSASGAPKVRKKQLSHNFVVQKLLDAKIIQKTENPELGTCLEFHPYTDLEVLLPARHKAIRFTEDLIVDAVFDWLRKSGFASYETIKKRGLDKSTYFGAYAWDITAPSYALPMRTYVKGKVVAGFVVADVVNGRIDERSIQYFIKKCKGMSSLKTTKPYIPFLIATSFSEKAFKLGKSEGYMLLTPALLFGETVAEALSNLTEILTNAAAAAAKQPEKIINVFNALKNIEGAAGNLRGSLFEMIAGHLLSKKDGASVDIGEIFTDENDKSMEVDVFGVKGKHCVYVLECKAKKANSLIGEADIQKWLNKRIPHIYRCIKQQERFSNSTVIFEYWTTSDFTDEAVDLLKRVNSNKFKVIWRNGKNILEYADEARASAVATFLKDQFFYHPLEKAIK